MTGKSSEKYPRETHYPENNGSTGVFGCESAAINALLVYPRFPLTYWGLQHALRIVKKKAALPPLGLLTLAALLPRQWHIRLVDLNLSTLSDDDLRWADAVFTGGMLIQAESVHEIIESAHKFDLPAIVGGPAATTSPEIFDDADIVFRGEAENRVNELMEAMSQFPDTHRILNAPDGYPDMKTVPVPRYDLLDMSQYASMSLQYSRGCPFQCEFCDIIEIFGRSVRVKETEHVISELSAMFALGYRGTVFFVDDNFIGNLSTVKKLLPVVREWQREHGRPFEFYTEAGIGLASEPKLLNDMVDAGFTSVFVGIETPSTRALAQAKKFQNLRLDLSEAVDRITRAGLEVMGGFIVGFDTDDEAVFSAQEAFLEKQPIPLAMVGILMALPGTALWRRLEAEGRLRRRSLGDQFAMTNFDPIMDEKVLIERYAKLMANLYSPEGYYRRCETYLARSRLRTSSRSSTFGEIVSLLRAMWHVGILSARRFMFWRLLLKSLPRGQGRIRQSVVHALQGEHFIRYTQEEVLPRLALAVQTIPTKQDAGTFA